MKIFLGNKGNVDFSEPIVLSRAERESLVSHLRSIFAPEVVGEEPVEEFRTDRLGDKLFARSWSKAELVWLLKPLPNEEVAAKLGRTWMMVNIKRGEWLERFLAWAATKGHDIAGPEAERLVEEYLAEMEAERILRTERMKADRPAAIRKRIDGLLAKIQSTEMRRRAGLRYEGDEARLAQWRAEVNEERRVVGDPENG